jgi:hypothetical protein
MSEDGEAGVDLRGKIELFGVTSVFQLLALAEATGKLVLNGSGKQARVYFHNGRLIYARNDAGMERIGDFLVRTGVLQPSQLEGAKMRADLAAGRRIGSILVESGSLTQEQLADAVREQIKEVVYDLVGMESGSFAFYSQIYPENEDILLDVSLDMLMVEGLRKLDELHREHGDEDE